MSVVTDRLVAAAVAGDAHAIDEIASIIRRRGRGNEIDQLLNRLARLSGESAPAVELLVGAIYDLDFARAEIRTLLFRTDDVEEVLQETALAVASGLPRFRGDSSFRTWARRISHNQAVAVLRRRKSERPLGVDRESPVDSFTTMVAAQSDVRAAVAALPAHFRDVVERRDLDQLTYEEIAAELNLPLNTVRSRLARGRARVQAALANSE